MRKKTIAILAALVFVFGLAAYLKTQAGIDQNMAGWLWGGSEDCDMDKNGFEDASCGGNNTTDLVTATGDETLNGNETGFGWVSFNSLNCDPDSDDTTESGSTDNPDYPNCPSGRLISNYGLTIPAASSGPITGYAWSENVGWIDFNPQDHCKTEAPGAGEYRAASCNPPSGSAGVFRGGKYLTGWARIVSIAEATVVPSNSGGWEGWIKIAGDNGTCNGTGACNATGCTVCSGATNNYDNCNRCNYGAFIDTSIIDNDPNYVALNGYAWSSELGWLSFAKAKAKLASNLIICEQPISITICGIASLDAYFSESSELPDCNTARILEASGDAQIVTLDPKLKWVSHDESVALFTQHYPNNADLDAKKAEWCEDTDAGSVPRDTGTLMGLDPGDTTTVQIYFDHDDDTDTDDIASLPVVVYVSDTVACGCNTTVQGQYCAGSTYNDSCGDPVCPGTKDCSVKWKEINP